MPRPQRPERCIGGGGARACQGGIVADLALQFKHEFGGPREADEFPLCLAHAKDESFLSWYVHVVHRVVLGTVRAMRPADWQTFRFTYKVVARVPCDYSLGISRNRVESESRLKSSATPAGPHGSRMIESKWKGRPYVRTYVVPRNPNKTYQKRHRELFSRAVAVWQRLSDKQREFYRRLASDTELTGFNLFIKRYVQAVRDGREPETPILLRWRTRGGHPVADVKLAVFKGSNLLSEESFEGASAEVALTPSDVPYAFVLRNGLIEDPVLVIEDMSRTRIPFTVESTAFRIKMVAQMMGPEKLVGSVYRVPEGDASAASSAVHPAEGAIPHLAMTSGGGKR